MKSPELSIIIPTFNAVSTLEKSLTSVINQTFQDLEVWVIDGRSSDNTLDIIRDFAKIDNRIHWVSEPDQGIYDAMNKGWLLAKGKWLYFMGSDDQLYDERILNNVEDQLKESVIHVLYGNVVLPSGKIKGGAFDAKRLVRRPICHQAMFFRNDLKGKVSLYNINYSVRADYDLTVRLFTNPTIKFKYTDINIAYFNDTGIHSFTYDLEFEKDIYKNFMKHFFPELTKPEILEGIKPSIFFHLKRGNLLKGLCWFLQTKKDNQSIRDLLYCLKVRVVGC